MLLVVMNVRFREENGQDPAAFATATCDDIAQEARIPEDSVHCEATEINGTIWMSVVITGSNSTNTTVVPGIGKKRFYSFGVSLIQVQKENNWC